MAGTDSKSVASSSIVCDPSNYDWIAETPSGAIPGDTTPIKNHTEPNAEIDPIDIFRDTEGPRSSPPPRGNVWTNNKTTDKDLFDFIYGESTNQTLMRLSNQFVPLVEEGADTLIYIGPPPKAKDQTDREYEYVKRAFHRPYLLRSDTLRSLGSAKFIDLLGPKSKRTQRKLQKAGIHKLLVEPDKIKYFIDLTPDIHDDEGMVLLLELSVPSGARSWHKDAQRFNIQTSHVCGRDALDMLPKPMHRPQSHDGAQDENQDTTKEFDANATDSGKGKAGKKAAREESDTSEDEQVAQGHAKPIKKNDEPYHAPEEDDYSQLRHHTGIARLLQAIAGHDPKLNSAPKAWTFCMLAKYFDCVKNAMVNRWITDWLVQSGNLNFIQTNPSTAYRFGMAMGAAWLVRASFCILVGLKAFEHVETCSDISLNAQGPGLLNVPPASRITEGLDDDDINRVDHAALALVKRVNGQLQRLLAENGEWKNCLVPQSFMDRLYKLDFDDQEAEHALEEAKKSLGHYVRRLLCAPFVDFDETKGNKGNVFKPPMNITSYHVVPALLRPLTLQFWEAMRNQDLAIEPSFSIYVSHYQRWERTLESLGNDGALAAVNLSIPYVSKDYLNESLNLLNSMHYRAPSSVWAASPTKKIKLSPPSKRGKQSVTRTVANDPPSAQKRVPPRSSENARRVLGVDTENDYKETKFTENFLPAQPATFLGPYRRPKVEESPKLTNFITHTVRGESLSYPGQSNTRNVKAAIPVSQDESLPFYIEDLQGESDDESDSDDWEDVMKELDSQSKTNLADPVMCVRGLPIRSKPMPSQISPAQASGEFSQGHVRRELPSTQGGLPQRVGDITDHLGRSNPGPRPMQYPSAVNYGNPSQPRPFDSPDSVEFSNVLSSQLKEVLDRDRATASSSASGHQSSLRVTNLDIDEYEYTQKHPPRRLPTPPSHGPYETPIFADHLLNQISGHVRSIAAPILLPGFMADGYCAYDVPLHEIGTLTCLSDDEYKYLPLWAGGNDDGSGGVFDDGEDIPEAPEVEFGGFRGGAMGIIPGVGSTVGGSMAGSEFEEISTEVGVSTVGKASRIATDGADTVMSLDE